MNILMVAAENGALPAGKVGGIGDVIRDMPVALSQLGHQVHVVIPGYQRFSKLPTAQRVAGVDVSFRGVDEHIELFELPAYSRADNVKCWVLEHPQFAPCGDGEIYCNDASNNPFAIDAAKFALFSLAVAQCCIEQYWGTLDVIHLHDWHAAFVALLARFAPRYQEMAQAQLVYTIHNLSIQGVRPLAGDSSSFRAWFPNLPVDEALIVDPRYPQCVNPMRLAITLCDKVHAVSPTYAREIQQPSCAETGYVGGDGLEQDLRLAAVDGRLEGILNGCDYPTELKGRPGVAQLLDIAEAQLLRWVAASQQVSNRHLLALRRLDQWRKQTDDIQAGFLVTFVGRITQQKVRILLETCADGRFVLEHLLGALRAQGNMILLGSGELELEQKLVEIAARHENLLFLCGYSDPLSEHLYAGGDLFLMPSSFEPCGISQMLAMRSGQLCLVHHVGGLVDTVIDNKNGFSFDGLNQQEHIHAIVQRFSEVLSLYRQQPAQWQAIKSCALQSRFLWSDTAKEYIAKLYNYKKQCGVSERVLT